MGRGLRTIIARLRHLLLPGGAEASRTGGCGKSVSKHVYLAWCEALLPAVHGACGGGLRRMGAVVAAAGEHEQAGSAVGGVRDAAEVVAVDQILDEFAGCLFGDAEVFSELSGRGRRFAQPGEGEPVHRAYVIEAVVGHALLDALDDLCGET